MGRSTTKAALALALILGAAGPGSAQVAGNIPDFSIFTDSAATTAAGSEIILTKTAGGTVNTGLIDTPGSNWYMSAGKLRSTAASAQLGFKPSLLGNNAEIRIKLAGSPAGNIQIVQRSPGLNQGLIANFNQNYGVQARRGAGGNTYDVNGAGGYPAGFSTSGGWGMAHAATDPNSGNHKLWVATYDAAGTTLLNGGDGSGAGAYTYDSLPGDVGYPSYGATGSPYLIYSNVADGISGIKYVNLSPPLSVPALASGGGTPTTAKFTATAAGGTAPITYQWYGSTAPGDFFGSYGTPNVPPASKAIAGATGATYTATGLVAGTPQYLACAATDASGKTLVSWVAMATPWQAPINLISVADSLGANQGFLTPSRIQQALQTLGGNRTVYVPANLGTTNVAGTRIENWLPTTDPNYVAFGGASYTGLVTAINAMVTANPAAPVWISVELGTNELTFGTAATAVATANSSFMAALVASGAAASPAWTPKFVLHGPSYRSDQYQQLTLAFAHQAAVIGLANGTTIFAGDDKGLDIVGNRPELMSNVGVGQVGAVHFDVLTGIGTATTYQGYDLLAFRRAQKIAQVIGSVPGGAGSTAARPRRPIGY